MCSSVISCHFIGTAATVSLERSCGVIGVYYDSNRRDMGFKDLIDGFRQEWPVIRQAPRTILLSVFLISLIAGIVEYGLFKEAISRKNDLIDTLAKQLSAKAPLVAPSGSPSATVSTSGQDSPATTGNGNTVTYGSGLSVPNPIPEKK